MASYRYREISDMHLIFRVVNCNGRQTIQIYQEKYSNIKVPCQSIFAILHRRLCKTGSFYVHKSIAIEQLYQFLQWKTFSKTCRSVIIQVHALYSETIKSPNLQSGAFYVMIDCIHFIYEFSHWNL